MSSEWPNRRSFLKRLSAAAIYTPPVLALLGATPAELRQSPFEKVKSLMRRSRRVLGRVKANSKNLKLRSELLLELAEFESEMRTISRRIPAAEMERLKPEFERLAKEIKDVKGSRS